LKVYKVHKMKSKIHSFVSTMKLKAFSLIYVSTGLFIGCHSNNPPGGKTTPAASNYVIDTSHMHVRQQPVDTSIQSGQRIVRYTNGIIKEKSYYIKGRRQGECQSFYPSGKLLVDDFFSDGIIDGPTINYYENGQKRYEGAYTKGKPSGVWKFYDDKGKLIKTRSYGKSPDKIST
jgi:antitoxin component YwqK of YwqJK toxin-antitoxin module